MIDMRAYLHDASVAADISAADKREAIGLLVGLLAASGKVRDRAALLADVLAREASFPTGLEDGCAVPHAGSDAMESTAIAAARFKPPVDFGSPDGSLSSLVFLMAGPKDGAGLHLKLLSKLARFMHDPEFRRQASEAPDAAALAALIRDRDA